MKNSKLLLVLFLLISSMSANVIEGLYKQKIKYYDQRISSSQMGVSISKSRAERYPQYKHMYESRIPHYKKEVEKYQKVKDDFEKAYKTSPKKILTALYEEKKRSVQNDINRAKGIIQRYSTRHPSLANHYKGRLSQYEGELTSLENGYSEYLKSLEKPVAKVVKKTQSLQPSNNTIANAIKNGTLQKPVDIKNAKVVSLSDVTKKTQEKDNSSKKLQPVELKSSNLNTATSLQNVNVGQNAKANVGGVSIGEEENK